MELLLWYKSVKTKTLKQLSCVPPAARIAYVRNDAYHVSLQRLAPFHDRNDAYHVSLQRLAPLHVRNDAYHVSLQRLAPLHVRNDACCVRPPTARIASCAYLSILSYLFLYLIYLSIS